MEKLRRALFGVVLAAGFVTCIAAGILLADVIRYNAINAHPPEPPPRAGFWDPFTNHLYRRHT